MDPTTLRAAAETALRHHCRLGEETAHPRFHHRAGTYSLVLTVNSGFE